MGKVLGTNYWEPTGGDLPALCGSALEALACL